MMGMIETGRTLNLSCMPKERKLCCEEDLTRQQIIASVHDPPRSAVKVENVVLESTLDSFLPLGSGAVWCDEMFFDAVEGDEDGPEDDLLASPKTESDRARCLLKRRLQGEWVLVAAAAGDEEGGAAEAQGRSWVAGKIARYAAGRNVGRLRHYYDVHGSRVQWRQHGLPSFTTSFQVDCGDGCYPPEPSILPSGASALATHAFDGRLLRTTVAFPLRDSGGASGFEREFPADENTLVLTHFLLDEDENRRNLSVFTFSRVVGSPLSMAARGI